MRKEKENVTVEKYFNEPNNIYWIITTFRYRE